MSGHHGYLFFFLLSFLFPSPDIAHPPPLFPPFLLTRLHVLWLLLTLTTGCADYLVMYTYK